MILRTLARLSTAAVLLSPSLAPAQYTPQTAQNLGIIDGMGFVNGSPGENGLVNTTGTVGNSYSNWYRFDVPDWRTVTIRCDSLGGPVNAGLYRSNGTFVRMVSVAPGMAQIMSEVLAKPVRFQPISLDAFKARLADQGMSAAFIQGYIDMMAAKNAGLDNAEPRTPQSTTPTSFRQWCEEVLKPAVLS